MKNFSFVKDSREYIRNEREAALDEIRKEQTDQKEKELAKALEKNKKGWNKSFVMGLAGLAVVFASATVVTGLSFPAAATTVLPSLFASYLVIAGTAVFYSNMSSYDTDMIKSAAGKTKEIEDKNRSENREATRNNISRLKREAKWLENKAGSYTACEQSEMESIKRSIDEKANSLINSSPARIELASRLRPELVKRFRAEKNLVR